MRAHVVNENVVVNTIIVPNLNFMPNLMDASLGGSIGDKWDGENFLKPEMPPYIETDEDRARMEIMTSTIRAMSYTDIENHINANVTSLAGARAFLIKLAKLVKAIVDRHGG